MRCLGSQGLALAWMLTRHAPWCRCDMRGTGWRVELSHGYLVGCGFELSWVAAGDRVAR